MHLFVSLLLTATLLSVSAKTQPDSLWIFRDSLADDLLIYSDQVILSTTPNDSLPERISSINDSGIEYYKLAGNDETERGRYINFDYQFTNGYAGCRLLWMGYMRSFDVNEYDSMSFMHQGPLPGHKVELYWACHRNGFPDKWQFFCEFSSSTEWKKECFQFPANFIKDSLFELRVLIHNDSGVISQNSPPGNLKLDDIGFIKGPPLPIHPPTPVPSFPVNRATLSAPSELTLSWKTSPAATSYRVQVSRFSEFEGFISVLDSMVTDTLLKAILPLPDEFTIYNWRLLANNSVGTSAWTDFMEFSVDMTNAKHRQPDHHTQALSATQNSGAALITAWLPAPFTTGTITIFSVSGQMLAQYTLSGSGRHTFTTANIPSGIHFLQMKAGGKTIAVNMIGL